MQPKDETPDRKQIDRLLEWQLCEWTSSIEACGQEKSALQHPSSKREAAGSIPAGGINFWICSM